MKKRRFTHGGRTRWPTAPPPYDSRYNLAPIVEKLPFELLRDHNYPRHPHRIRKGLEKWRHGGQRGPQIFANSGALRHPYTDPTSGPRALDQGRRELEEFVRTTAGAMRQAAATPHARAASNTHNFPRPYLKAALSVQSESADLPAVPRYRLPPAAEAIRREYTRVTPRAVTGMSGVGLTPGEELEQSEKRLARVRFWSNVSLAVTIGLGGFAFAWGMKQ